ncbi:hypothetical protein ACFFRU_03245, partial [Planobispora longispora]
SGSAGTAQAKKEALEKVGVRVGKTPSETARLMRELLTGETDAESRAVRSAEPRSEATVSLAPGAPAGEAS